MEYLEGKTLKELLVSRGPDAGARRDRLHAADPLGARFRPPARHRPPRHQAAQRRRRTRRASEGDGLRDRPLRFEPDDRGGLDHRHGAVPLARAGAGQAGAPVVRPVLGRSRALRDAHGHGPVLRRHGARDRHEAPEHRAGAAVGEAAARDRRGAARARPRRAARPGQGFRADRYRTAREMDADLGRVAQGLPVAHETEEAATAVFVGRRPRGRDAGRADRVARSRDAPATALLRRRQAAAAAVAVAARSRCCSASPASRATSSTTKSTAAVRERHRPGPVRPGDHRGPRRDKITNAGLEPIVQRRAQRARSRWGSSSTRTRRAATTPTRATRSCSPSLSASRRSRCRTCRKQSVQDAVGELTRRGLNPKEYEVTSSQETGTVTGQSPAPGTRS